VLSTAAERGEICPFGIFFVDINDKMLYIELLLLANIPKNGLWKNYQNT
jgi:hypothetical protein